MSDPRFDNFGDLYRAAFAETDPEQKQVLLADVKNALDQWAEADNRRTDSRATFASPKPLLRVDRTSIKRIA